MHVWPSGLQVAAPIAHKGSGVDFCFSLFHTTVLALVLAAAMPYCLVLVLALVGATLIETRADLAEKNYHSIHDLMNPLRTVLSPKF